MPPHPLSAPGRPRLNPGGVLIAGSLLLAVGAGTADAAWTPPEPVLGARDDGRIPEGRMPAVAYGAGGGAAIAWVHGPWARRAIVVTVRGRDGRWDSPVRISPRTGVAIDPRVAVDHEGRTLVVWRQTAGTQRLRIGGTLVRRQVWVVRARWRDAAGRWTAVDTLSPTRLKVGAPELAMDAAGDAVATWHWGTGSSPRRSGFVGQVQAAEFRDLAWRPMTRVSVCGPVARSAHPASPWAMRDTPSCGGSATSAAGARRSASRAARPTVPGVRAASCRSAPAAISATTSGCPTTEA